jgi:hypothetical protein
VLLGAVTALFSIFSSKVQQEHYEGIARALYEGSITWRYAATKCSVDLLLGAVTALFSLIKVQLYFLLRYLVLLGALTALFSIMVQQKHS